MVASKLGLGFRVLGGQPPARQTVSQPANGHMGVANGQLLTNCK